MAQFLFSFSLPWNFFALPKIVVNIFFVPCIWQKVRKQYLFTFMLSCSFSATAFFVVFFALMYNDKFFINKRVLSGASQQIYSWNFNVTIFTREEFLVADIKRIKLKKSVIRQHRYQSEMCPIHIKAIWWVFW